MIIRYRDLKKIDNILKIDFNIYNMFNFFLKFKYINFYNLKNNIYIYLIFKYFMWFYYFKVKNFELKYWYLTPTVYDGRWHYYSNKNLDDLYVPMCDLNIRITHPVNYRVTSELDLKELGLTEDKKSQITSLYGNNRVDTYMSIDRFPRYSLVKTDDFRGMRHFMLLPVLPTSANMMSKFQ